MLILGIAFQASDSTYIPPVLPEVSDSVELWQLFREGLPTYFKEIATSLLPIILMFGVFQLVALKLDKRTIGRIAVGLAAALYMGLVLLTGANVGLCQPVIIWGRCWQARASAGAHSHRNAHRLLHRHQNEPPSCAEPAGGGGHRWCHLRRPGQ